MKNTHGGSGRNQGAKPKYGEKTINLTVRVPESKKSEIKSLINEIMLKYIPLLLFTLSLQAQDTLVLNRKQINNVYIGLKERDQYKQLYDDCYQKAIELDWIIKDQNDTLQAYLMRESQHDELLFGFYKEREESAVKIAKLESKGWSFWDYVKTILAALASYYVGTKIDVFK